MEIYLISSTITMVMGNLIVLLLALVCLIFGNVFVYSCVCGVCVWGGGVFVMFIFFSEGMFAILEIKNLRWRP